MPEVASPWIGADVGAEAIEVASVLEGVATGAEELGTTAGVVDVGADGGGILMLVIEVDAGTGIVEVMGNAEVAGGIVEETGTGRTFVASLVASTELEAGVGAAMARVVVSRAPGVVHTVSTTKSVIVTISQSVTTTRSRLLSGAAEASPARTERRVTSLRCCIGNSYAVGRTIDW